MDILKKQGVAVMLTAVMMVVAVIIGMGKAPAGNGGGLVTNIISTGNKAPSLNNADRDWYVVDGADVLSSSAERDLRNLNEQLYRDLDVIIAVVTTPSEPRDLAGYTMGAAEDMGLAEYDFIVVLDITGEDYCLLQGYGLVDVFTDKHCYDYADRYMESNFAREDYDEAVLDLAEALAQWYYANYRG